MKMYHMIMSACLVSACSQLLVSSDERPIMNGSVIQVTQGSIRGLFPAKQLLTLTCGACKIQSTITFSHPDEQSEKIEQLKRAFLMLMEHQTASEINRFHVIYPGENDTVICRRVHGPRVIFHPDGTVER